jgi:hypothetical protein
MQKDMLDILQAEGFQINDRELLRLRLRFKWLLRESTGKGTKRKSFVDENGQKLTPQKKRRAPSGNGLMDQLADAILQADSSSEDEEDEQESYTPPGSPPFEPALPSEQQPDLEPLNPEEALRRQIRIEQLQIESAEKWRTRKRRRRTRGWAGLPADAPGEPPRFPSETTLDESKAYLSLDNTQYQHVRKQFQGLCEEEGVIKKTIAGPEKWTELKRRLVRENDILRAVFEGDEEANREIGTMPTPSNFKALSLDVICTDVTKRMRMSGNRMGIPEAKNVLGLNPQETRTIRANFHTMLKADHFTNKYEAGDQHWNDLKQAWIQGSALLTRVLSGGEQDERNEEKLKAIEVLARDVMKRLRAENTQKDPSRKKQVNQGPGPGPAPPSVTPHTSRSSRKENPRRSSNINSSQNNTNQPPPIDPSPLSASSDLQIDPSLLLAANESSLISDTLYQEAQQPNQSQQHNPYVLNPAAFIPSLPLPIYFRLHPHSSTSMPNKTVWLGILQSGTVSEVRNLATREHPGTMVAKVEGLVVHKMGGQEREIMFAIDDEDELGAYLEHINGGKATFVVLLVPAQQHGYA